MEVKKVNFKRFIASEGMALKWKTKLFDYSKKEVVEDYMWSSHDAVIDTNSLIGEVEEIPYSQYEEETKFCGLCKAWC